MNDRYSRQLMLKDFGPDAQMKLLQARVLVIGAGGLGCPALLYLATAGIGSLGVADGDTVELSNLHRQVLFDANDIGQPKASLAARKLSLKNPEIDVAAYDFFITPANCFSLISRYDVVVDATDNFASRYLISDACAIAKKPLVYGAISGYQGQAGIFNVQGAKTTASYRDLFPVPPVNGEVDACNSSGVIGVLPGIMGTIQAAEVIKIITGTGTPLIHKIFTIDISDYRTCEVEVIPTGQTGMPATEEELMAFNYHHFCNADALGEGQISMEEFNVYKTDKRWTIVDVREPGEVKANENFSDLRLPMSVLTNELSALKLPDQLVLVCASGVRSEKVRGMFKKFFPEKKVLSLKGGLLACKDQLNINDI